MLTSLGQHHHQLPHRERRSGRESVVMGSRRSTRPSNHGSEQLSGEENAALFGLLGRDCYSLACGVVQVLKAHPNPATWTVMETGVLCVVKDYAQRTYFLRLYDLGLGTQIWEQRMYEGFMVGSTPAPVLLTFEGDHFVYGLNFSSAAEAKSFRSTLEKKANNDRSQKRKSQASAHSQPRNGAPAGPPPMPHGGGISTMGVQAPMRPNQIYDLGSKDKAKGKNKKKKLNKADIGQPTNFVHKAHVGWDQDKGFETTGNEGEFDPTVAMLMQKLGYDKASKENYQIAYDVIERSGGMDKVREDLKRQTQIIAPPQRPPAPPSHRAQPPPPPPVPPQNHKPHFDARGGAGPPRPPRDLPPQQLKSPAPPPPPAASHRPLPQPPQGHRPHDGPPPPPPPPPPALSNPHAAPPPPPPPPPPPSLGQGGPPPPPPPPMGGPSPPKPAPAGGRADLLADIRNKGGIGGLKKTPAAGPAEAGKRMSAPKDDLNDEIRRGVQLKAVDPSDRPAAAPALDGIAGAIAKALAERRGKLANDDDESEGSGDEDDDDWDD